MIIRRNFIVQMDIHWRERLVLLKKQKGIDF